MDGDETSQRAVEEGEVKGEGNLVMVLARDTIIEEERFLTQLGYGLDAMGVEKVVEEEDVVRG